VSQAVDLSKAGPGWRLHVAREMRRMNPKYLPAFHGFLVRQGINFNPYRHVVMCLARSSKTRDEVLAELLVADLVTDAVLHPDLQVTPHG
jgi:hypothetical protein